MNHIALGTKVVINTAYMGALPHEIGKTATIVNFVHSFDEKYFKKGAYYLNPPIGNNTQYQDKEGGWGIGNESFAVLGGKEKVILKDTYFVITDFGKMDSYYKDKNKFKLNTVYKQLQESESIIISTNKGDGSYTTCQYFGYSDTAKEAKTRMRYATPIEMEMYNRVLGPVPSLKAMTGILIGQKEEDPIVTISDLYGTMGLTTLTGFSKESLVVNDSCGSAAWLSIGDIKETKEERLQKLTEGIIMQKPILIPTTKKKIKKLI